MDKGVEAEDDSGRNAINNEDDGESHTGSTPDEEAPTVRAEPVARDGPPRYYQEQAWQLQAGSIAHGLPTPFASALLEATSIEIASRRLLSDSLSVLQSATQSMLEVAREVEDLENKGKVDTFRYELSKWTLDTLRDGVGKVQLYGVKAMARRLATIDRLRSDLADDPPSVDALDIMDEENDTSPKPSAKAPKRGRPKKPAKKKELSEDEDDAQASRRESGKSSESSEEQPPAKKVRNRADTAPKNTAGSTRGTARTKNRSAGEESKQPQYVEGSSDESQK